MKQITVILVLLLTISPLFAETRTWTSNKGKTIEAELAEFQGDAVKLKKADGSVITVRLNQLSETDRDFLTRTKEEPAGKTNTKADSSDTQLEVFAVSVSKEIPRKESPQGQAMIVHHSHMGSQPGTTVSFLVPSPEDSSVLGLSDDSVVGRFVDDKQTDLLVKEKKKGGLFSGMIFGMPGNDSPFSEKQIDEDGEWIIIDCHAPKRPLSDSASLRIEGKIALRYGKGTKTNEHKNIPLDGKGKFVVAGQTITVKKSPQKPFQMNFPGSNQTAMKTAVTLSSKSPLDSFFSIVFYDAKGKEIEFRESMSGSMNGEYMENYDLAEEVDSVSIEIEEYETIETVEYPVAQTISLGFP